MNRFLHGVARAATESFCLPGPILDVGAYQVQVSNALGTVTSAPAQLLVVGAPAWTLQPANVSVAAVVSADRKMTDADQEGLNVDPTAGKSINAIRDFTGKGTLVWGSRSLAGNDNEWNFEASPDGRVVADDSVDPGVRHDGGQVFAPQVRRA